MYNMLLTAVQDRSEPIGRKTLLLSVNPELKSDFGHFLNYEKRMNEVCARAGIFHHCLSNITFVTSRPFISKVFQRDSGHYCLYRKDAVGHEAKATAELHAIILDWMTQHRVCEHYDEVIVFIYQSSGRSAAYLSCLEWPANTRVVANGFWDFLIPQGAEAELDLARLKLQTSVEFLAMSSSHRELIRKQFGHAFPHIPNPPPLVSDRAFANMLRQSYAVKTVRARNQKVIFFPGLMSVGKGSDITADFLEQIDTRFPDSMVVARDRSDNLKRVLAGKVSPRLSFASGDFPDKEIIGFYESADVAVLPYSSEVFRFRTSGALVDCLMSATVPVVFPNTWLAAICAQYDFGVIAAGETVEDLISAAQIAVRDLKRELARMMSGALRYLQDNSWQAFIETLVAGGRVAQFQAEDVSAPNTAQFTALKADCKTLPGLTPDEAGKTARDPAPRSTQGAMVLDSLAGLNHPASARLLLTSVGNGLLMAAGDTLGQLQRDPKLAESVRRALIELSDDDPHKGQFLRVWARFGDRAAVAAAR